MIQFIKLKIKIGREKNKLEKKFKINKKFLKFVKSLFLASFFMISTTTINKVGYNSTIANATVKISKHENNSIFREIKEEKITLNKWIHKNLKRGLTDDEIVDKYFKLLNDVKSLLIFNSKMYEKNNNKRETVSKNERINKRVFKIEDKIVKAEEKFLRKIVSKALPKLEEDAVLLIPDSGHGPGNYGLDGGCSNKNTKENILNENLVYEKIVEILKRTKNVHILLCYPLQNSITKKTFKTDKRLTKKDLKRIHCAFDEVYLMLPINGSFDKESKRYIRRKVDASYEIKKAFAKRILELNPKKKIIAFEDHHDSQEPNVCCFNPHYRKFEKKYTKGFYKNSKKFAEIVNKHCAGVYEIEGKNMIWDSGPKEGDFKTTARVGKNNTASILNENGNIMCPEQLPLLIDIEKIMEMAENFVDAFIEFCDYLNIEIIEK